jgi:hypothetical protein
MHIYAFAHAAKMIEIYECMIGINLTLKFVVNGFF